MATINTGGSGNWSSTTPNAPWVGGVPPVLGDKVNILTGHTVTLDGTYSAGDDTTTAINVTGTLKASRAVSSQLTVRGELFIGTAGTIDFGTEADPIPSSVTAVLVLNDSATMATQKYGISSTVAADINGFRLWGADKTGFTTMSAALATDVNINVANATGWQIGDWLCFAPSVAEGLVSGCRFRAITNISGTTVTIGADLGFASQAGREIINMTRNVKVKCVQGNSFRSHIRLRFRAAATTLNVVEIGPCELNISGGETNNYGGALNLEVLQFGASTYAPVKRIYRPAFNPIWSISGSTVTNLAVGGGVTANLSATGGMTPFTVEEMYSALSTIGVQHGVFQSSAPYFKNCRFIGGDRFLNGFGDAGIHDAVVEGGSVVGIRTAVLQGLITKLSVINTLFNGITQIFGSALGASLGISFDGCTLGGTLGIYNTTSNLSFASSYMDQVLFNNCTFPAEPAMARTGNNVNTTSASSKLNFRNWNTDPSKQKQFVKGGIIYRDNAMVNRGLSSLAISPWYSGIPISYGIKIPAKAGETVRVVGYLRFNSAYLTATPPSVTISGLTATPVSFTATATADTWQKFDLSITNPLAYSSEFDLTVTGQSAANSISPICWLDGVAMVDVVPATRHYGFLDTGTAKLTTDPNATQAEATVAGRASVDTLDDFYDAASYWTVTTPISGAYRDLLTAVGSTLNLGANNLVVDGTASDDFAFNTGTNTITIKSSVLAAGTKFKTFTTTGSVSFINGASSSLPYTSSAGTVAIINVTGLVAGSRVYLKNTTNNTNLYNAVVAGTSLALPVLWTADKTIRLRVQYTNGTTSYLPVEQFGILTSSGASFVVSQAIDSVYAANAVNGSTVTEFSADYPNVQVDITDPDGITSMQRLYAWYRYNEFSASGIEFFQSGIVADDPANYQIHASIINLQLDNKNAAPVLIIGARLYRDDGTTIIYSGSGSIQLDPAKAYLAGGAAIAADVRAALKPDFGLILAVSA